MLFQLFCAEDGDGPATLLLLLELTEFGRLDPLTT